MLDRPRGELGAVTAAGPAEELADEVFDVVFADVQVGGHLLVGETATDERQQLALAGCYRCAITDAVVHGRTASPFAYQAVRPSLAYHVPSVRVRGRAYVGRSNHFS